jgi:hypothetical protein
MHTGGMLLNRIPHHKRTPRVREGIDLVRQQNEFLPTQIDFFDIGKIQDFRKIRIEERVGLQRCHISFDVRQRDLPGILNPHQPLLYIDYILRNSTAIKRFFSLLGGIVTRNVLSKHDGASILTQITASLTIGGNRRNFRAIGPTANLFRITRV